MDSEPPRGAQGDKRMKKLTRAQEDKVANLAYNRRQFIAKTLHDCMNMEGHKVYKAQAKLYADEIALLEGILNAIPFR
jgi:hypothetical protein